MATTMRKTYSDVLLLGIYLVHIIIIPAKAAYKGKVAYKGEALFVVNITGKLFRNSYATKRVTGINAALLIFLRYTNNAY